MIRWAARATLATLVFLPSLFVHIHTAHAFWLGGGTHPLLGVFIVGVVLVVAAIVGSIITLWLLIAAACGEFG